MEPTNNGWKVEKVELEWCTEEDIKDWEQTQEQYMEELQAYLDKQKEKEIPREPIEKLADEKDFRNMDYHLLIHSKCAKCQEPRTIKLRPKFTWFFFTCFRCGNWNPGRTTEQSTDIQYMKGKCHDTIPNSCVFDGIKGDPDNNTPLPGAVLDWNNTF